MPTKYERTAFMAVRFFADE